jgi:hypothetical protein
VKIKIDQYMNISKLTYLVIVSCWFATAAPGAENAEKRGPNRDAEVFTFDLSFPGGTVAEFVAQTEKAFERSTSLGDKPNLIIPAGATSLKVPKLELRSVDIRTLLNAVSTLLGRDYVWQPAGGTTWVLYSRPDNRNTQAFFVGHLLQKFKIEDVTTAIETVWQMDAGKKGELKYHQDTQLLIIRADKAQLEMATNVLTQLRDALVVKAADPVPVPSNPKAAGR